MQFEKRTPTEATPSLTRRAGKRQRGFTLIELLVVIAIIAILAAILLPVLHQAQLRGETAACIDHQKQLATAWVMYSSDNNDYCAGNYWPLEQAWKDFKGKWYRPGQTVPCTNWISGWLDPSGNSPNGTISGVIGMTEDSDNTNQDLLVDASYASLGDYTKNPGLFICPACEVMVPGNYPNGAKTFQEIRSVSMNCWVGFSSDPPSDPYKMFNKTTSITAGIGPADLFVFMEERGESIDDGSFETQEGNTTMANWPTDYHNLAATVGFADGHVDVHRWFGTPVAAGGIGTTAPQQKIIGTKWATENVGNNNADLVWLQTHASIPLSN